MKTVSALVIEVSAAPIGKYQSDYLTIRVDYQYRGPPTTITGYGVVTQEKWYSGFDEIGSSKRSFSEQLPNAPTPTYGFFLIPYLPLSGCEPDKWYGVKVHIDGVDEWGTRNCLYIWPG